MLHIYIYTSIFCRLGVRPCLLALAAAVAAHDRDLAELGPARSAASSPSANRALDQALCHVTPSSSCALPPRSRELAIDFPPPWRLPCLPSISQLLLQAGAQAGTLPTCPRSGGQRRPSTWSKHHLLVQIEHVSSVLHWQMDSCTHKQTATSFPCFCCWSRAC
jgi:hypothetical protein